MFDGEAKRMALTKTQRAAIACEHCRKKKIRCDGIKPTCSGCASKGLECRQDFPTWKPRPTNKRIRQLERENQRLRALSGEHQRFEGPSTPSVVYQRAHCAINDREDGRPPINNASSSGLSPLLENRPSADHQVAEIPQAGHTGYHGPTSALYDEARASTEHPGSLSASNQPAQGPDGLLVAEAAKERHMEMVNLARGKLDFDGNDPDLGMHLLSLFWTRHLHAGLIVYRPTFMRDMARNGPYFSKLLLNAMFFSVSKHSPRTEIQCNNERDTAGWLFRQRFTELLRFEFNRSSIPTIQALLIMASSLFTRGDERSTSWLFAGNAFNMVIDLGLHVEPQPSLSSEEREARRRVFWASFVIDKIQCLYQGRQPCLRFADTDVVLRFMDDFEDYEQYDFLSFSQFAILKVIPSRSIQLLERLCTLSIIMERVYSSIYAIKRRLSDDWKKVYDDLDNLQAELQAWRSNLPEDMDLDASSDATSSRLPYNLSILALWNVLEILLHRPLISDARLRSADPERAYRALTQCSSAARDITTILRAYARSYDVHSTPFLLSYTTYIAANIHVHVLAKSHDNPSTSAGATQGLQICLLSLGSQASIYSAAEKAMHVIEALMDRMNLKIDRPNCPLEHGIGLLGLHKDPTAAAAVSEKTDQQDQSFDFLAFGADNINGNLPLEFFQTQDLMDFDDFIHF